MYLENKYAEKKKFCLTAIFIEESKSYLIINYRYIIIDKAPVRQYNK